MVKDVKILGYRVYVEDKDYLYYETEDTAISAAKMFATESRKTKATVVMEVEVWNSGGN
jgi:hypothetical protein